MWPHSQIQQVGEGWLIMPVNLLVSLQRKRMEILYGPNGTLMIGIWFAFGDYGCRRAVGPKRGRIITAFSDLHIQRGNRYGAGSQGRRKFGREICAGVQNTLLSTCGKRSSQEVSRFAISFSPQALFSSLQGLFFHYRHFLSLEALSFIIENTFSSVYFSSLYHSQHTLNHNKRFFITTSTLFYRYKHPFHHYKHSYHYKHSFLSLQVLFSSLKAPFFISTKVIF